MMADCRTPLTQRTRAATVAQTASMFGSVAAEARRAALLFRGSAMVLDVAEPHGTQRPSLVGLEGGMDAGLRVGMRRAGAHFENLDSSGEGRARRECIRSWRAECCNFACHM